MVFVLIEWLWRISVGTITKANIYQFYSIFSVLRSSSMICTKGDRPRFVSSLISPASSIILSAVFLELPHMPHFMQAWFVTLICPDVRLWLLYPHSFLWYAIPQIIKPTTPAVREILEALWNHFRGNGPLIYSPYCRDFGTLTGIEESKDIIDNNYIRVRVNKKWEENDRTWT